MRGASGARDCVMSKDSRFKTRRTSAREGGYVSSSGDEREEVYSNAVDKEYAGDVQSGDESYREEFYTGRESSAREEQPMPYLQQGDEPGVDEEPAGGGSRVPRGPVMDEKDIESMFLAARHNKHKELKALLDKGIPPNMADQHGNTILIVACQNGNKRVVRQVAVRFVSLTFHFDAHRHVQFLLLVRFRPRLH